MPNFSTSEDDVSRTPSLEVHGCEAKRENVGERIVSRLPAAVLKMGISLDGVRVLESTKLVSLIILGFDPTHKGINMLIELLGSTLVSQLL